MPLLFSVLVSFCIHITTIKNRKKNSYSVAGTYDGTTWKLYVNGELKHTKTYAPPKGITNLDVNNKGYTPQWFVGRHGQRPLCTGHKHYRQR
ncbi:MAG: LamG domain-containing protein [Planctomycetaceae bacterium]|nr:LamG domain-containing protein [Planctomycetaceae bacterium]